MKPTSSLFSFWYLLLGALLCLCTSCKKDGNAGEDYLKDKFITDINGQKLTASASLLGQSSGAFLRGNDLIIIADGEYYNPIGKFYIHISNYTGPATYQLGNGSSYAYYKPNNGDTCFSNVNNGIGSVTVDYYDASSIKTDCIDIVFGGTRPCTLTVVDFGVKFWFDAYSRTGNLMKVTKGTFFMRKTI